MERATAKGREAGAEDRAGVDEIGVGDDALGERGLRFGDEGPDQAIGEPGGNSAGRPLRRLATRIIVEAAPGLAPEMPGGHQLRQFLRRRRVRRQHPADGHADVEADGVGELDRSHRHAERKCRLVDRLRRDALVDQRIAAIR